MLNMHRAMLPSLLLMLAGLMQGCSTGDQEQAAERQGALPADQARSSEPVAADRPGYTEAGDLDALKRRGKLRILLPANLTGGRYLPRKGSPVGQQQEVAEDFARSLGLEPVLVPVAAFKNLIPELLQGKGDLIAANLTVTEARKEEINFSVPLDHVREQLVTRLDDGLDKPEQLAGRTIAIETKTSFWDSVQTLQQKYPELQVEELPPMRTEDILDRLARGEIDLTVQDSNEMAVFQTFRDDLRVAFDVSGERAIAWGVRPDAPQLLDTLNRFLERERLTRQPEEINLGDLPSIQERKVLRVLMRNNAAAYFLWRGELLGFEYELAKEFAKRQGLRLQVVVPPDHKSILPWLLEGRADIAAAFLTPTETRKAMGVTFSRPYHYAPELVVARAGEQHLASPSDLAGRTLVVRRSSSYWNTLEKLRKAGIALDIAAAPEDLETEEIIARVASGEYDLTVADGHILDIELAWRDDIESAFPLGEALPHGWAVRPGNPKLLAAINAFFKKEYRGLFYNLTYNKYFRNPRKMKAHVTQRVGRSGSLSPYDRLVTKYADMYDFDWRLIVAQIYQESRFNPEAASWAGALGLLQVMPRTAREMGFNNLKDPEEGLHAGVRYLDWLRQRFEPELPVTARMWFALASYNAGAGHVRDARRLARQKGWDPNRWFNNVERAMLLLSKRKYARQTAHGYVRGQEPVRYVRQIRDRFSAYVRLTDQNMAQQERPASTPVEPQPPG
jgi:membrane-bound lytic murein transglycosylase F